MDTGPASVPNPSFDPSRGSPLPPRFDIAASSWQTEAASAQLAELLVRASRSESFQVSDQTVQTLETLGLGKFSGWPRMVRALCAPGSSTNHGTLRLTEAGRAAAGTIAAMSRESVDPFMRAVVVTALRGSEQATLALIDHAKKLLSLGEPERDVRKLYLAIAGDSFGVHETILARRLKEISIDHAIDQYLRSNGRDESATNFLRDAEGGNYCPAPFPSYHPFHDRAVEESRAVVARARQHSYVSFVRLAQETRRLPDHTPPLIERFGQECFDLVAGIYGSSIDRPPGRGLEMSGARLDRLFFERDGSLAAGVERFGAGAGNWLAPALDRFEETSYILLRGAIILINNAPEFTLDGERYCYYIPNDHQEGSYLGAHLLPTSVVSKKIGPCQFDLKEGPDKTTADVVTRGVTVAGLVSASLNERKAPLNVSWLSTLFGSCACAYPPEWKPYFEWESSRQGAAWKDYNRHVHASYLIWHYREDRDRVAETLGPLQELHGKVHAVVEAYQQLWDLFRIRYGAWKNDQTPGEKSAPRMLVEAYSWFRQAPRMARGGPPILCLMHRHDYSAPLVPLLDCADMGFLFPAVDKGLPRSGDGTDNREIGLWNRYIRPRLFDPGHAGREGAFELALISREYVPKGDGYD